MIMKTMRKFSHEDKGKDRRYGTEIAELDTKKKMKAFVSNMRTHMPKTLYIFSIIYNNYIIYKLKDLREPCTTKRTKRFEKEE